MIQFPCPACGRPLTAQDALAGQQTRCAACGCTAAVPRLPPSAPPLPPLAPPSSTRRSNFLGGAIGILALTATGAIVGLLPPLGNWAYWHPLAGAAAGGLAGLSLALWGLHTL